MKTTKYKMLANLFKLTYYINKLIKLKLITSKVKKYNSIIDDVRQNK